LSPPAGATVPDPDAGRGPPLEALEETEEAEEVTGARDPPVKVTEG
jgi:hypothetical protein